MVQTIRDLISLRKKLRDIRENRCFKCHQVGHRWNDPSFHPRTNTPQGGAGAGSTGGPSQKAGNATFEEGSEDRQMDDPIRLNAAAYQPRASSLYYNEYVDAPQRPASVPPESLSWRSKNYEA